MITRFIILVMVFVLSVSVVKSQRERPIPPEKQTQIDNYLKSANEAEYKGDFKKAANVIKSVADIYYKYNNYVKAIELYQKSILYSEKIGDQKAIALNFTNIGVMYYNLDNADKVMEVWKKSLEIRRKLPNREDLSSGLYDFAWIHWRMKKLDEAIQKAEEGLAIAKNINNSNLILNFYILLSDCYTEVGNKKLAQSFKTDAEYLKNFLAEQKKKELDKRKEIVSQTKILETEGKVKEEQLKNENLMLKQKALKDSNDKVQLVFQKQKVIDSIKVSSINAQNTLKNEKKIADLAAVSKQQKTFLIASIITAGLILILAGFILYRLIERRKTLRKLKQQNDEIVVQKNEVDTKKKELEGAFKKIERQHIEITSSIGYASRIQFAILSPPEELTNHLPESFVLFKPRDIVSGDYYWFNKVTGSLNGSPNSQAAAAHKEPSSKIVVSAIDCTGHGVPGAMLSMIANNLLHQIIVKDKIHNPGLILEKVNRGIRKILKQETSKSRDGMDMSIAIIDEKEKYVEFSGAKSPMVYIQDGEMQFIKGDFEGIGGLQMETEKKYETVRISVEKPTVFYQFSDGYGDQFGGDKGKKLMSRGFRDLLVENHKLPMKEQREILDKKFTEWKGRFEQVDDILVIGYKVGF